MSHSRNTQLINWMIHWLILENENLSNSKQTDTSVQHLFYPFESILLWRISNLVITVALNEVKKYHFCHTFHLRQKCCRVGDIGWKVRLRFGKILPPRSCMKSDFSVSLCPFSKGWDQNGQSAWQNRKRNFVLSWFQKVF